MNLKPAWGSDSTFMYYCRYHETTRPWCFGQEVPSYDKYLDEVWRHYDRHYWIAFDPIPIGILRSDAFADGHELSWIVAPGERGKGYGLKMVQLGLELRKIRWYARIKPDNVASIKIAQRLGFIREDKLLWQLNGIRESSTGLSEMPRSSTMVSGAGGSVYITAPSSTHR